MKYFTIHKTRFWFIVSRQTQGKYLRTILQKQALQIYNSNQPTHNKEVIDLYFGSIPNLHAIVLEDQISDHITMFVRWQDPLIPVINQAKVQERNIIIHPKQVKKLQSILTDLIAKHDGIRTTTNVEWMATELHHIIQLAATRSVKKRQREQMVHARGDEANQEEDQVLPKMEDKPNRGKCEEIQRIIKYDRKISDSSKKKTRMGKSTIATQLNQRS